MKTIPQIMKINRNIVVLPREPWLLIKNNTEGSREKKEKECVVLWKTPGEEVLRGLLAEEVPVIIRCGREYLYIWCDGCWLVVMLGRKVMGLGVAWGRGDYATWTFPSDHSSSIRLDRVVKIYLLNYYILNYKNNSTNFNYTN